MNKSITYFAEVFINKFTDIQKKFYEKPEYIADFVYSLSEELRKLGMEIFKETLEDMNQELRDSPKRKREWHVEKHDSKKLITSLGTVDFKKTLFTHKESREMTYLLDHVLGLSPHQLLTEDAVERVYQEAVQTSYRRGGESVNGSDFISSETVKDILHNTKFPKGYEELKKKREVEYLYIDADEDHVSLQFQETKGDLVTGENGRKKNGLIAKLIYVYEGVEPVAPKSKRHRLINTHYVCRVTEDNEALWDEVYDYIEATYDVSKIKQIYLNGDGGAWIKAGCKRIAGVKYVLDEFHLSKYLLKMTGHMMDTQEDARIELCEAIRSKTKSDFREIVERLKNCTESEAVHKKIEQCSNYVLLNWGAAKLRLKHRKAIYGCSAEGHVSHVLSSRMSSRPMGWSRLGAAQMAHLREWYYNKGSMLELARYQREAEELPKAAGAENAILSAAEIWKSEKTERREWQKNIRKYEEALTHEVSIQSKKRLSFHVHGWL